VQSILTTPDLSHATHSYKVDHSYSGCGERLAPSTIFLGPNFLTAFFQRHATVARLVIFLPATVNLLLDSQLAWTLPFGL
jgi:hypothetical protein